MPLKIYTKKGDQGKTSLLGGQRVSKGSLRIAAYGSVDTLNAYVGWVRDWQDKKEVIKRLTTIQRKLFTIGALLAVDADKSSKMKLPEIKPQDIEDLEKDIDRMEEDLPPLQSFILPGGHQAVSACHLARCHCREAERNCVVLGDIGEDIPEFVIPYLNRLSDYFFVLSRWTAQQLNIKETEWEGRK